MKVHRAVLWLISLNLHGRGSLTPLQTTFGAPGTNSGGPDPLFLSSCLPCIRCVTWTAKALTVVLLSLSTALLHLSPSTGLGLSGLQVQPRNERRNFTNLLIHRNIYIFFKNKYLFLYIILNVEPHGLGKDICSTLHYNVYIHSLFQHCYFVFQAAIPCERRLLDAFQSKELASASLLH